MLTIFGIGCVGKTTLATKLAISIQDRFEYVIWRSLQYTPPGNSLLTELGSFLCNQQETTPDIDLLIHYLRTYQCLLVLDNFETILDAASMAKYRPNYLKIELRKVETRGTAILNFYLLTQAIAVG
ncbi:MAG: hypothetical protein RM049_37565 [Nostoc sp. DedQUE04]|uniref:NB-ARC domain-containing protein n=1 Tax=Nostoc sp. DedQUE04 TaxID=3075390 RepID=UPI002AD31491|nr:NB-ARC domain-containing protein [Nostoc sp. DedQUE04]MDZ8140937.1 hypothetical protein [Nostoc sp. DedQUE04]